MIALRVTAEGFSQLGDDATTRILARFQQEAVQLLTERLQAAFGEPDFYPAGEGLTPGYQKEKRHLLATGMRGAKRLAGKSDLQEGILTESVYEGIAVEATESGFTVQIDP